jgi:hypothetical protein
MIVARAEALFTSDLSIRCHPSEAAVAAAIRSAVGAHGVRGCAGEVGAAYGDCPETAAARMQWARQVIEEIYSPVTACMAAAASQPRTRAEQTGQPGRGRRS